MTSSILTNSLAHVFRSYLAGLTLSTAGSSTTFSAAAGVAADSTNALVMNLASAMSKTTGAWAAGTGNGALDTSTIAASTWYHVHLIAKPGGTNVDVLISLSATAPTLPSGYTLFRRIGSMRTDGSSNWLAFTQNGDTFLWSTPIADVNVSTQSTTNTGYTISVPNGVFVEAVVNAGMAPVTANTFVILHSPLVSNQAANSPTGNINMMTANAASSQVYSAFRIPTSNAQIRAAASGATSSFQIATTGWIDRRGRDN